MPDLIRHPEQVMNIHSKKRNCKRCFAGKHFDDGSIIFSKCELGFDVKRYAFDLTVGINGYGVPQERCPKPLTISDFIFASKNYHKGII